MDRGGTLPWVKWLGREDDHTPVCSAEFKNKLSPRVPLYLRGWHRDEFTFFTLQTDIINVLLMSHFVKDISLIFYCVIQLVMKLREKPDLLLNCTEQEEVFPNFCKPSIVVFITWPMNIPFYYWRLFFADKNFFSCLLSFLDSGIPRPVENFVFIVQKSHRNFDCSVRNAFCLSVTHRQAGGPLCHLGPLVTFHITCSLILLSEYEDGSFQRT